MYGVFDKFAESFAIVEPSWIGEWNVSFVFDERFARLKINKKASFDFKTAVAAQTTRQS